MLGEIPEGDVRSLLNNKVLEYVMGLMGPLVLGLIRDKSRLLRGQVSLAWESSKPLYIKRGDVSI